ncbi:hypothetical protein [Nocardia carnea]|uniref:hypothetical protein n=1 Tax=Nocardia carnea TaxID=37328 RepID=UPI0024565650|nr:hypothetical protein [Nocardia carnea]
MSFFSTTVSGYDGLTAEYRPAYEADNREIPAAVFVRLDGENAYLMLSIEDTQVLAAQLPLVLAEHQRAARDPEVSAAWSGESKAA